MKNEEIKCNFSDQTLKHQQQLFLGCDEMFHHYRIQSPACLPQVICHHFYSVH